MFRFSKLLKCYQLPSTAYKALLPHKVSLASFFHPHPIPAIVFRSLSFLSTSSKPSNNINYTEAFQIIKELPKDEATQCHNLLSKYSKSHDPSNFSSEEITHLFSLLYTIANFYYDRDDFPEAIKYFSEAVILAEKSKTINVDVGYIHHALGSTYNRLEEFEKALESLNKASEILATVFPNESTKHIEVDIYSLKGQAYLCLGDHDAALENFNKALENIENVYESSRPTFLKSIYKQIENIHTENGDFTKAFDHYKKGLEYANSVYGYSSQEAKFFNESLAQVSLVQSQFNEALEYAQQALEISEKVFGEKEIETAGVLFLLGQIYTGKRDSENSIKVCEKFLNLLLHDIPGDHQDLLAETYLMLVRAYSGQKDWKKARENYEKGLEIYKELYGESSFEVAKCYSFWGQLLGDTFNENDMVEAETLFKQAVDIYEKDDHHDQLVNVYGQLGKITYYQKKLDEAVEHFKVALEYLETGEDSIQLEATYSWLGKTYSDQENWEQSASCYEKAANTCEALDNKSQNLSSYYRSIGNIHSNQKSFEKAEEVAKKALNIDSKEYGVSAAELQEDLDLLFYVLEKLGKQEEIEKLKATYRRGPALSRK